MIIRIFLTLFVFLVFSVTPFGEGVRAAISKNGPHEIKLSREILGRVPTVEVTINGKIRTFYLDTGGGISAISPALAKEIGCTPFGEMTGYNAGGAKFAIKRCEDVAMDIDGFSIKRDVAVFDPMEFFPKAKAPVVGSIALDAFEHQFITLDLKGDRIWVENEKTAAKKIKSLKPLTSRISRELGGASLDIFLAAQTPNGRIWMLMDTGNTNKLLLRPSAQQQLGISFAGPNGEKLIKPIKLNLIGLGEIEADARERDMIYDGMLSYDVINSMLFTIDLRTGQVWAKLN